MGTVDNANNMIATAAKIPITINVDLLIDLLTSAAIKAYFIK
jgi:hypothetical protein